jgi:hypothetical protein
MVLHVFFVHSLLLCACFHTPFECAAQMGTLTELQAVQKVMSAEQMRSFRISTLALSVGLVVSVVSVLFISFLILVVQLRIETLRIRRDARSAKARRLRDKASGAEITVPPTGHEDGELKYFHVFLSHVWGCRYEAMNERAWCFCAALITRCMLAGRAKTRCASSSSASRRWSLIWRSSSTYAEMFYPRTASLPCSLSDVATFGCGLDSTGGRS